VSEQAILTCVPGIVAGGPGQRVSETIEEVEEGPGQDDDIESGIKLDHNGRIAGPWKERGHPTTGLSIKIPI